MNGYDRTTQLQLLLDRIGEGDCSAREELLVRYTKRLDRLTRAMLRDFPGVKRWQQTSDVRQNASLRLWRALENASPHSIRHFYHLAALQIRRELIDLARSYYGPEGLGRHHESLAGADSSTGASPPAADSTCSPSDLADWAEFHEQVDALPAAEREVFDLLWYQELTQAEAAELLNIDVRTVKRRWQSARLMLHEALSGEMLD